MPAAAGHLASRPLVAGIHAYGRLGKLAIYEQWLVGPLVAWSLLDPASRGAAAGVGVVALVCLASASLLAAASALDDVQGVRDGIDARTHEHGERARNIRRKPLLVGELSQRDAVRFAYGATCAGVAAGLAAFAVAPHRPAWLVAVFLAGAVLGVQYAYGLKVSYHGGGEALLFVMTAGTAAVPFILVEGGLTWAAFVESGLVGAWMIQANAFSNTADAESDRTAGRLTMAVRLAERGNRRFIASVFCASWTLILLGVALGALPAWILLALVPCAAIQVLQLRSGPGQGRWLSARRLGFRAFDAGALALIVVNLTVV